MSRQNVRRDRGHLAIVPPASDCEQHEWGEWQDWDFMGFARVCHRCGDVEWRKRDED